MKKIAILCILPIALAGLTACGDELIEDISLEEATYLSALEDEDLGTGEGDAEGTAEEAPSVEEQYSCSFDEIRQRLRNRFDQNGDGEVTDEEQEELNEAFDDGEEVDNDASGELGRPGRGQIRERIRDAKRRHRHHKLRRLRWIYDADNSGSLDAEEKATLRADIEARCEAKRAFILETFDTDGDGVLSDEEKEAARSAKRARHQERRDSFFDAVDSDGDGQISREEFRDAKQARKANRQERRANLKAQFDADEDGTLSDDEKNALREYLREWVRGEHLGEGRPGAE